MNEKYMESYTSNYPQCAKQNHQNETPPQTPYYSYFTVPLSNTFSPTNFLDIYGSSSQNVIRNQNNCIPPNTYHDQSDGINWENRILPDGERNIKVFDKLETLEITSKELSPTSIELFSDFCKPVNKDTTFANKCDNQWYYNQSTYVQKSYDYSSCALAGSDKTLKCAVQKKQESVTAIKSCSYVDNIYMQNNCNKSVTNDVSLSDYSGYQYYDKFPDATNSFQNEAYLNPVYGVPYEPVLNNADQQTEESNEESDIIVEESDEEITIYNEDHEQHSSSISYKCLVCDLVYAPLGTQFYFLTSDSPLTMSSQIPVINRIVHIVGKIVREQNYLCSECLGLINTIDHLQLKLNNLNKELCTKFEKTCEKNNVNVPNSLNNPNKLKKRKLNFFQKYRCRICRKVLCFKRYCLYHHKKHKQPKILCELCGKIFLKSKNFKIHAKVHHRKNHKIDSFKCQSCEKIFRTRSNLKEHVNFCLGTYPYACKNQYCDKKFASPTKLKNHVKLKHDKKFIAICSICNIGFIKVSDYKSHMVTHSTEKKFQCEKCDKSYKTLSNLNFHMKVHNDKMPFICKICDKGFMRKEYLEAHVNNHNGVKNYICTICDKRFVSQKNLDAHLKYHEGTVTKNTCNICGKTMTTGFEEHLRVHSNMKEFECQQCDKRFNTKGTLKKHVVKKHNISTS